MLLLGCPDAVLTAATPPPAKKLASIGWLTRLILAVLPKMRKFWALTLVGIALLEYRQISIGFAEPDPVTGEGGMREDYVPGDLGFDPLGLAPENEEDLNVMKTKELNNGRLAVRATEEL